MKETNLVALVLILTGTFAEANEKIIYKHAFPEHVYKALIKITEDKNTIKTRYSSVKNLICDGSTPKVIPTYKVKFVPASQAGLPLDEASSNLQEAYKEERKYLKTKVWKDLSTKYIIENTKNETVYHSAEDLAFLMSYYTFVTPRKFAEQMDDKNSYRINQWGYGTESDQYGGGRFTDYNKFHISQVIGFRELLWDRILERFTSVKEAPQEDGSVNYEVQLDLTPFCKYGTAIEDLTSN